jgi:hypothetical protein
MLGSSEAVRILCGVGLLRGVGSAPGTSRGR